MGIDPDVNPPVLSSREVEEALVAALLLHDDYAALDEFTEEEIFYDDIRPITGTVRMLRGKDKPCGTVFVLAALEPQLDELEWKGDRGEVLVLDMLSRHVTDVQAYYGRQLGRLVHYYAERRKAMTEAQEAAKRTFVETLEHARKRYEGEM